MQRGLITIVRDYLFAGWKQAEGSSADAGGLISLMGKDMDQAAIHAGDYASQIAANKGTVYACTKLTANAVSSTTLRAFRAKGRSEKSAFRVTRVREVKEPRRSELLDKAMPGSALSLADDVEEIVGGHRLIDLLRQVNSVRDNFGLKFLTSAYLSLLGNCYWVLFRDAFKVPEAIWVVPAEYMKVIPGKKGDVAGYVYRHGTIKKVFDVDDVIHFKVPAPGYMYQFYGRGDLMGVMDAFNLETYIQKFEEALFKNGAWPGGVLSTTTRHNEAAQKRLKAQFDSIHASVEKAGKWFVMENVEPKQLSLSPRELAYQSSRKAMTGEIANGFLIPRAILEGQVSTRAALETSLTQFAMFAVLPQCILIDEALTAQLCPQYPDNLVLKFDNPVPADKEHELKRQEMDLKTGKTTIDEERTSTGLEPFGGAASEPMVDSTRVPLSMVGQLNIEELARSVAEKIAEQV